MTIRKKNRRPNFAAQMIERARQVASKLPKDEALSYLACTAFLVSRTSELTGKKSIPIVDEEGKISRVWLPIFALHIRGIYLEKGEQALLNILPYWIYLETDFFLAEPWLRELFGQWMRNGKEKKVKRAFFGTPKRGTRSFDQIVQNHARDIKIAAKIDSLKLQGLGYNAAIEKVRANLKALGVEDHLSFEAIRSIYKKIQAGYNPLIKLFEG
jgi:hypothetical protein